MKHAIDIVIVNWNTRELLRRAIMSVREKTTDIDYRLIVVDNASVDGSSEMVAEEFPEVTLVQNTSNAGFAKGNNTGARAADGDLLLLLNSDAMLSSSILPAIREFERHTSLGALGCRMYYPNGGFQPSFGFEHTPLRLVLSWVGMSRFLFLPRVFRREEHDKAGYETYRDDIAWVSGAFLMTRRSLWEALDGFDERYFMYVEDVDYCKRVRDAGYLVAYTPNVEILHYGGAGKEWCGESALKRTMMSYRVYLAAYHGKCTMAAVGTLLGAVMMLRAVVYGILSIASPAYVLKEKRSAYMDAAMIIAGMKKID